MSEKFTISDPLYIDTGIFLDYMKKHLYKSLKNPKKLEYMTGPDGNKILGLPHEHIVDRSKPPPRIDFFLPADKNGFGYTIEYPSDSTMGILYTISPKKRNYFISYLVEAEANRHLRATSLKETDVERMMTLLKNTLRVSYVKDENVNGKKLSRLALKYPIKKNVQDLRHILIAKKNDCWLLTNDKLSGNLEKIREEFFNKILSFDEFKQIARKEDKNLDEILSVSDKLKQK